MNSGVVSRLLFKKRDIEYPGISLKIGYFILQTEKKNYRKFEIMI